MNLIDFLDFLFYGAYPVWKDLVLGLTNQDIKALRLVHKTTSNDLFPLLFTRIYISAHNADLDVFRRIAQHPVARQHVRELVWDDCTFDRWIGGQQTYTDRLLTTTTLPSHHLKREQPTIAEAYRFWASEAASFAENREENVDKYAFDTYISAFPSLSNITILSRSRLTYVDPDAYWQLWQTPRLRRWNRQPFCRHLLHPEPFKPSTGTTVSQSEGIRPIQIIRAKARSDPSSLRIGHLSINSIGGGQSRASGSTMVSGNRFERRFVIDLHQLTSHPPPVSPGKVALNLLLETQTEDMFRNAGVLEDNLDLLMMDAAPTLESLTIAHLCLDWLLDYSTLVNTQFPYLRTLRRVTVTGGSSSNPFELLLFLARQTSVREVVFDELHLEAVAWEGVLRECRREGIAFDVFELTPSRARDQLVLQHAEPLSVPSSTTVGSERIVPWLKGETEEFPLL